MRIVRCVWQLYRMYEDALTMLRLVKRLVLGLLAFTVGAVVIAALLCRDNGEASYEVA